MSGRSIVPWNDVVRPLVAGIFINMMAGLLYVWSLFIVPIEQAYSLDRAELGIVSSLALVSFTIGVFLLPKVLGRLGRAPTAMLVTFLIAGGHAAFGVVPGWRALLIAYGIGFGLGSGLAYGFALALMAALPDEVRAKAIGVALSAFAMSGILLPFILGEWIASTDPAFAFLVIGLGVLAPGIVCTLLLAGQSQLEAKGRGFHVSPDMPALDRAFFLLSVIFFGLCFVGLAIVSQAAAIASAAGLPEPHRAPTALTLGYLAASLVGAPLADRRGERLSLVSLAITAAVGAVGLLSNQTLLFLAGAAMIGASFGGLGSVIPVLIGRRYGTENISSIYGKMMFGYGLAGLIAPGIAGAIYASTGSYTVILLMCVALAMFSVITSAFLERRRDVTRS